jgi:hypothetical protein
MPFLPHHALGRDTVPPLPSLLLQFQPTLHTRNSILSLSVCLPCQRVNLSTGQLVPSCLINRASEPLCLFGFLPPP